ncbi:ABC transporter permease [Halalkalibacter alkalisediminis]|uniref:ABC transporter permease n=1 Tax=Halalkalibacter alkalisediminis TaxID=935616 RepID=A0ABV6NE00_9BACI|nr:ABC transporter permease [Halalkalibacter alkalisediminis]
MARTEGTIQMIRKRERISAEVFFIKSTKWISTLLTKTISIILLLLAWELIPRFGLVEVAFFPPFSQVATGWYELILSGQLAQHITASLARSIIGFTIAVLSAIPLGIMIGWFKLFSDLANPLLEAFRNTAALAILPVFILLLGIGEASKIAVVIYACTFPILISTISAVRNVDPLLIKSAKSMAITPIKLFIKVILPAASSILVLIAAEMIGAKAGLGFLIINSQHSFQIPYMYAGILTISAIGMLVNYLLLRLERRLSRWKVGQ